MGETARCCLRSRRERKSRRRRRRLVSQMPLGAVQIGGVKRLKKTGW
jgi:hypothetical protein